MSTEDAAGSPTKFGPTALDYPKLYKAAIVPSLPGLEGSASSTASLRSGINVSTTRTFRVYGMVIQRERSEKARHGWGESSPCGGDMNCGRILQHGKVPSLFLLIVLPSFRTLAPEPSFARKRQRTYRDCQGYDVLVFRF